MKELSRVASAVQASTTVAIDSKAKQMKADGIDVVGFGAGEPDFNTPDNINMEAIRAICDGKTKYTPPAGIIPLRKAICNRLKLDCNLDYDYTQIVVASGAKHCVYVTFRALLNPGDEVIVPAPYWVSYSEMIKMAGGVPILVVAGEDQGFKATGDQIKAAITEKTKCVIINNPSNPTGALYSKQELQEIADICVENDLYIISDEIYYQLIYDNVETKITFPTPEELKTIPYRSKIELTGKVRIVEFPGGDICACCGTHVRRTGEIGLIKVLSLMNHKGGVRIELVCGRRAMEDYDTIHELNRDIAVRFSRIGMEWIAFFIGNPYLCKHIYQLRWTTRNI